MNPKEPAMTPETLIGGPVFGVETGDLSNMVTAKNPGEIPDIQAASVADFIVSRNRLPYRGTVDNKALQVQWESVGFTFGDINLLWACCQFPQGWRLESTDHPMWICLVDEQGRKRASIFLKATRDGMAAHTFGLDCRYHLRLSPGKDGDSTIRCGVFDRATEKHVHVVKQWASDKEFYADRNCFNYDKESQAWLNSFYPDHRNPLSYW